MAELVNDQGGLQTVTPIPDPTLYQGGNFVVTSIKKLEQNIQDISLTPGPQGEQGEPGPSGATGGKGDKGDTGATGSSGVAHAAGTPPLSLSYDATSQTINGRIDQSIISLNKTQVGLANVDNTSDADKPVSTAQQTALNGYLPLTDGNVVSVPNAIVDIGGGQLASNGQTWLNDSYGDGSSMLVQAGQTVFLNPTIFLSAPSFGGNDLSGIGTVFAPNIETTYINSLSANELSIGASITYLNGGILDCGNGTINNIKQVNLQDGNSGSYTLVDLYATGAASGTGDKLLLSGTVNNTQLCAIDNNGHAVFGDSFYNSTHYTYGELSQVPTLSVNGILSIYNGTPTATSSTPQGSLQLAYNGAISYGNDSNNDSITMLKFGTYNGAGNVLVIGNTIPTSSWPQRIVFRGGTYFGGDNGGLRDMLTLNEYGESLRVGPNDYHQNWTDSAIRTIAEESYSWPTNTDSSRKGRSVHSVCDVTAAREVYRMESDGSHGYLIQSVSTTAPVDSMLINGSVSFYADGSGNLKIKLKDSSGTVRSGTITLT